jgi:hypothetical protein
MLSPSQYKSKYRTATIPVFSIDSRNIRAQNIADIYSTKGISSDLYTRTLTVNVEDLDNRFYRVQHTYAFDRTGKWLRFTTEDGIAEYHLPTGRRMLGIDVEYPSMKNSRFQTVEDWLLTSLRSSQKRICPNSYLVVELDTSDIEYSELSTFVSDDLLDRYCQYP